MARRIRWLVLLAGAVVLLAVLAVWQTGVVARRQPPPEAVPALPPQPATLAPTPGLPWFEDVTAAARLDFVHFDSATPMHYIQETMGSGLGWIDFNGDGWPDLFCVQDGPVRPEGNAAGPTCKLYRNNGDGTFTDVTAATGAGLTGFGMGCAVGDFDNDGFDDLAVTFLGKVVLLHNEPGGPEGRRFVDASARSGVRDPHWATSCGWGDVDGDGFLDLHVCNYVEVDLDHYPHCAVESLGLKVSCPPTSFPHTTHALYRNNGDGTFTDVSKASGIAVAPAPGLGVVLADLDGDGRLDIYAANDKEPAYLFHNRGGGRFEEKGFISGASLGSLGLLMAGMGVAAGDVDGSGRPALFVTNFQHKGSVLFRNQGNLNFLEWSNPSGLSGPSRARLGFGAVFLDADLDGRLDLAVANGHVDRYAFQIKSEPFAQEAQLFLGLGGGRFRDVSSQAGPYFRERRVGRGLAWADFDNDGRPDLAFSNNGGAAALLRNATATDHAWLGLELVGDGKKSNRNAVGARVEVECGTARQVHFVLGGGSYLSASDRRLLIGLGSAGQADRVTVRWPSGATQQFQNLVGRRRWRLREGNDRPEPVPQKPARAEDARRD